MSLIYVTSCIMMPDSSYSLIHLSYIYLSIYLYLAIYLSIYLYIYISIHIYTHVIQYASCVYTSYDTFEYYTYCDVTSLRKLPVLHVDRGMVLPSHPEAMLSFQLPKPESSLNDRNADVTGHTSSTMIWVCRNIYILDISQYKHK